jgi:glucosamine-6-phosphate deaminase
MAAPAKSYSVDSLKVQIYANQPEMAADAAREVNAYLQAVLAKQGAARVILATGNSQIKFLEALIALGGVDWSRITLFHMDEYLGISREHQASFRWYMREKVEALVHPKAFHYLEGDCLLPLDECARYTGLLQERPIDLCCLGIGENGHIAFNDPPVADFNDPHSVKLVKLDDACKLQQVRELHFPNLEAVPQYALTLTIPMLCSAKKMVCLCPETRKAAAVRSTLTGPISTGCPASHLRKQPHCVLMLDAESASLL